MRRVRWLAARCAYDFVDPALAGLRGNAVRGAAASTKSSALEGRADWVGLGANIVDRFFVGGLGVITDRGEVCVGARLDGARSSDRGHERDSKCFRLENGETGVLRA